MKLSAIIPTKNEEGLIEKAVASLTRAPGISEVIVADGGSTDATCKLAELAGARVVHCTQKGRGLQIAEAWQGCQSDVLVVLHADALFPRKGASAIANALRKQSIPGGAFSVGFSPSSPRTRFIARLNHLRARLLGISFGDQCQFVRDSVLQKAGGFPAMLLMEDVELSLIMKKAGKPVLLPEKVWVSPRRWEEVPFASSVLGVILLCSTYLFKRLLRHPPGTGQSYYNKYYRDKHDHHSVLP